MISDVARFFKWDGENKIIQDNITFRLLITEVDQ